ncbi:MAG: hypothetical protein PHC75_10250 [Burkholderiales bacterium]|nr:hypothetical protein [Burkholderiales bacterium]
MENWLSGLTPDLRFWALMMGMGCMTVIALGAMITKTSVKIFSLEINNKGKIDAGKVD